MAAGVNCDVETAHAFELAGAVAERVHVNDIIERPDILAGYQILALPGGFSFGDDIASGQVLAKKLKHRLAGPIDRFVDDGKLILGICNGFQVLVKLGLLPGSLTFNASAKFEDRWTHLKTDPGSKCVFTAGIEDVVYLPVRHGEGRFVIGDEGLAKLKSAGQVVVRYVDADGASGSYPANPNGSLDDIAGVCDPTGRIFGLMPHPEVFVRPTQHPRWTRGEGGTPDGIEIFRNAVAFFS